MADNPQDKLINLQAQQLAAQVANWAAQLEFQKERLRLLELPEMQGKLQIDIDKLAWQKAQDTWEQSFKESSLTGTYKGQPTLEWLTQQAQLTGVLNGQQTLQGKLTDAQINQMNQTLKLANDQFVTSTTGYYNGQKTFDRQKFEAGQAQDAWKFLAQLTGPSNAFKQAKAISTMPGGMQGIMEAWAGQYSPAGFGGVGSGGRASMEGLLAGGGPGTPYYYPPYGTPGPPGYGQPGGPSGYPPGYGGDLGPYLPPPGYGPPPPASGAPPAAAPPAAAPQAAAVLDENSPQYRAIQDRYRSGQITQQQAANEWAQLTGTTAPVYADLTGPNSPAYRDIQARMAAGTITAEQGAAEWAAIQGTGPKPPAGPAGDVPPAGPPNPWAPITGEPPVPPGTVPPPGPGDVTPGVPNPWAPIGGEPGQPPGVAWTPPGGWQPGDFEERPMISDPGWSPGDLKARQGNQQGYWAYDGPGGTPRFVPMPAGGWGETPESGWYGPGGTGGPWQQPAAPGWAGGQQPAAPGWAGGQQPSVGTLDTNSPQYRDIQARMASGQLTAEQGAAEWAALTGAPNITQPVIPQAPYGSGPPGTVYALGANQAASGMPAYSYQGAGIQAPTQGWNYSPNMSGSMGVYPPGVTSPWDTPDVTTGYPISPQMAQNVYQYGAAQPPVNWGDLAANEQARYKQIMDRQRQISGAGQGSVSAEDLAELRRYQARMAPAYTPGTGGTTATAGAFGADPWTSGGSSSMPAPNQINARNYANSFDYQKELGWAAYEDQGYDKGLAQEAFKRSLPKTGGPKQGSYAF